MPERIVKLVFSIGMLEQKMREIMKQHNKLMREHAKVIR